VSPESNVVGNSSTVKKIGDDVYQGNEEITEGMPGSSKN
jgi:hypothetical protein